ncbi:CU044_2847 family protein [Streptomyces chartreusis]|uniref:CU044_2847 family protein n=1 Tax=Streptomyces chartreusis TaxID=1969 RepID=UPI0036D893E8
MARVMQVEMPDGQQIWAQVEQVRGPQDSGLGEQAVQRLQGFTEMLRSVAASTRSALAEARPDDVSVEFGLELAAGKDGIVAALVGASGTATVKVTLSWSSSGSASSAQPVTG